MSSPSPICFDNRFADSEADREAVWSLAKKCEEVDSKGVDGNALDQFQANRLIEAMIKTDTDDHLTFKEVRDAIAKTEFQPSKKKLSLIEFAVFKFGLEPKQLLLAEQTDNFDGDALIAAAVARWEAADAAVTATTATEAAAATAVTKADAQLAKAASGREEIAFLEETLAEHMAGLELAVENAEGAVKSARAKAELEKMQKLGEPRELLDPSPTSQTSRRRAPRPRARRTWRTPSRFRRRTRPPRPSRMPPRTRSSWCSESRAVARGRRGTRTRRSRPWR